MRPLRYRTLLIKLANELRDDNFESLKFFCIDHIPRGRLEEITTVLQLWEVLEEKDLINEHDVDFLKASFETLARNDLKQLVEQYEQSETPNRGEAELKLACTHVANNLGLRWKQLGRELGLKENELEAIVERYPRDLHEQVLAALRCYQTKPGASHGQLVRALRRANLNNLADQVLLL